MEPDLLKTETIGDAYCVAGGLHRASKTHAQQTAWMALKMREAAEQVHTPDGQPVKSDVLHVGEKKYYTTNLGNEICIDLHF
ncbi:guanylate cyclase soluble subunit alpha-1 [Trichonephila inaurata madagascariensis]|uniref:Guanylate cyclase soluble subunit alpha-1 n=1 Tax=Trichonephila inaurata madagascariensis TaxID=2747483 RepID=A0A8X7CR93_9ARAC|nr:guanylate cyclase soluble subunit alpha-1 [Trichonephila inaurata madagascariensis]